MNPHIAIAALGHLVEDDAIAREAARLIRRDGHPAVEAGGVEQALQPLDGEGRLAPFGRLNGIDQIDQSDEIDAGLERPDNERHHPPPIAGRSICGTWPRL